LSPMLAAAVVFAVAVPWAKIALQRTYSSQGE
jgi:hypothetical protein